MAWTKTKTVVAASVIALLAATIATIAIVEIHKRQTPKGPLSPSTVIGTNPDSSWTNNPLF
ncbi:MAG TPA: hypothetical protein VN516_02070, partial [Candidatus Baltobacteraceae bacterium]|nr:hypothetical protein [Candidatus Baltobacteraceae bacterium]